jgi:hypothetical protein
MVAAAAIGIHQRQGLVASGTRARGLAPTSRRAAARIASSIAAGGVSRACSRQA